MHWSVTCTLLLLPNRSDIDLHWATSKVLSPEHLYQVKHLYTMTYKSVTNTQWMNVFHTHQPNVRPGNSGQAGPMTIPTATPEMMISYLRLVIYQAGADRRCCKLSHQALYPPTSR